jgi:uncharacterized membrane protein YfcA
MLIYVLTPLVMLTAWAYASVGLGGGTAYLSIMSFWQSDPAVLRPLAWSLNIATAAVAFLNFSRRGHFDARLAWPFLAGGVVGAAGGGGVELPKALFQAALAAMLIYAAIRMLWPGRAAAAAPSNRPPVWFSLLLGTAVGIVSGLVGIGGGIVLGPVLLGLRYVDMKTLAPITSLYILLNSCAALAAFLVRGGSLDPRLTGVLCGAALAGGFLGSRWGARTASESALKKVFGLVALAAGIKLLCEYLGILGG